MSDVEMVMAEEGVIKESMQMRRGNVHKSLRKKCMNIHLNSLGFQGF